MKLWNRALEIIPGGNQLVSKRPNRYCPDLYPSHYVQAYDNIIHSAEGKQYKDFSTMGVGCCTLGYQNRDVDAAVLQAIAKGNVCSLNSIEELMLTEKLLELNPKMDMLRYARTGGEAMEIARRICHVSRDCEDNNHFLHHGYSGWHLGTPEHTYGFGFDKKIDLDCYNETAEYLSCVIMEPVRNKPEESLELMKYVRKWCTKYNVPLIFDEITSGFRVNIGGYHITKNIYPDIVVYGKALGNGYPICAVMGTRDIMENAEKTFISSTFWSERTGYAAALETINQYEKLNVPEKLIKTGKLIQEGWKDCAEITGVDLDVHGIYPLSGFRFREDHDKKCTYLTQEFLKHGFLATDQFYSSIAHTEKDIGEYLNLFENILNSLKGNYVLECPVRDAGWKRCN